MNARALFCSVAFSPSVFNTVSATQVRQAWRDACVRWGRPHGTRLDNGCPWGNWSELPTALPLWLEGIDVHVDFIPPRRPEHNGVVERSNGTTQAWVEVHTCETHQEVQSRLEWSDQMQREEYPHACGKSRGELFPALRHSGREYSAEWEQDNWDLRKAQEYLAGCVACRQVCIRGRVKLYARSYCVGLSHKGERVAVQYDPEDGQWLFCGTDGTEWCRRPAEQITRERILALDISDTVPNSQRGKKAARQNL